MPLSPSRFLVLATLVLLPLAGAQAADYVVRSEDPNVPWPGLALSVK